MSVKFAWLSINERQLSADVHWRYAATFPIGVDLTTLGDGSNAGGGPGGGGRKRR